MEAVHADIDARGEPLAALTASEGGIYERFGYGVATLRRITMIDRRRAELAPEVPAGDRRCASSSGTTRRSPTSWRPAGSGSAGSGR